LLFIYLLFFFQTKKQTGAVSPESLANISVGEFAAKQRHVLTRSHLDIALIVNVSQEIKVKFNP
jgi:hypothetical protein